MAFSAKSWKTIEKVIKFSEESMVFTVDEEVERSSNFTVSIFQRFGHVEGSVCRCDSIKGGSFKVYLNFILNSLSIILNNITLQFPKQFQF